MESSGASARAPALDAILDVERDEVPRQVQGRTQSGRRSRSRRLLMPRQRSSASAPGHSRGRRPRPSRTEIPRTANGPCERARDSRRPARQRSTVASAPNDIRRAPLDLSKAWTTPFRLAASTSAPATMGPPASPRVTPGLFGRSRLQRSAPVSASTTTRPPLDGVPNVEYPATTSPSLTTGAKTVAATFRATGKDQRARPELTSTAYRCPDGEPANTRPCDTLPR